MIETLFYNVLKENVTLKKELASYKRDPAIFYQLLPHDMLENYKNCLPDGTVDLMNLTPGDIIKRNWSFRVNAIPEYLECFRYDTE